MINGNLFLLSLNFPQAISQLAGKFEKEDLLWVILLLAIPYLAFLLVVIIRKAKNIKPFKVSRLFKTVSLEIKIEKDKPLRPQVLTLTIRNTGKNDADIEAPVLEFRKIWSKRKFKLSGVSGQPIYPMFIYPGRTHQLRIETSTFHQYDRSIKSFYWARILVSDVDGRNWKSNTVKLRKSLFT